MRYFKLNGTVYAYDKAQIKLGLHIGKSELTAEELSSHLRRSPSAATKVDIESSRLRAYADPLTGSDRLFSESLRMQIMGESGHEEVRARAIARFGEIQTQYPWPSK